MSRQARIARFLAVVLSLGAVAGCTGLPTSPDVPFVPLEALGGMIDTDQAAGNIAAWAFASPANTRGRPIEAARAVIAIEYLPGTLADAGRYPAADPLVIQQLKAARQEVRQALGIAPGAPAQAVVNAMMTAEDWLFAGNPVAAQQEFVPPVFTLGPQQTLALLADLPALPVANVATQRAQFELQPSPRG